jgi:hypothetical protein
MIEELDATRVKPEPADQLLEKRTQAMMIKAGLPSNFVREDLGAPPYFSMRSDD